LADAPMFFRFLLFPCLILWLLPAAAAPRVLATIKPIHSLVAAVMRGAGVPELLIGGAYSEHSYALKPSDARKIAGAQIVFEVGPDLETYLVAALPALAPGAQVVALESVAGVRRLPARKGGLWEGDDDDHGPSDPHVWLDPENAIAMTRAITATLSRADAAHAGLYRANAAAEIAALRSLEKQIAITLAPVRARHYLVFHDAYHYFETRFGLSAAGSVTVAPDRPIGPARVAALRARIAGGGIACIFREPQFPPRLIDTLAEGNRLKTGILDPLGADLQPGPGLYPALLRNIAAALAGCLKG
ncbi:MAG TPA: zinc ABC transporter substrate-binding protein, partial [Rhizomicrobium sp.]